MRERRAAKGAPPAARSRKRRDQLVQELIQANRAYQIAVDKMDDAVFRLLGINGTDGRCLDIIDLSGGISAGELARAVDLSPAAVTSVIDRLERMGLVERARDPEDRRRVIVRPTDKVDEVAEVAYLPMGAEGVKLLGRPLRQGGRGGAPLPPGGHGAQRTARRARAWACGGQDFAAAGGVT
jgi:DNA-binding MarR family transcriptional regulator